MLKAVIFDIGNVLLNWDPDYLYAKLIPDADERARFLREVVPGRWNVEQDRGRPWPEAEAERIALYPEKADLIRAYRARWIEMVPNVFDENLRVLQALLAQGIPVYAITNFAADTFKEAQERFPFLKDFKGVVVSGTERLIKPDAAIFTLFLTRFALKAEDCLFIDDSLKNIEAAARLGFSTLHVEHKTKLRDDITRFGFHV